MNILAIESSCDETACAVVKDGTEIISNVIASSSAMHEKWGGIVPEVAAREQLKCIVPVIKDALQPFDEDSRRSLPRLWRGGNDEIKNIIDRHIDAIAVTVGPGLIGSLLIGIETAKTLAFVTGKPIIPVNHVLAHMYANFLNSKLKTLNSKLKINFPAISLVVSGGHTELFLMKSEKELKWLGGTIDDAAGEAFDKTARLLGFGSRGGLAIQEAAHLHFGSKVKGQRSRKKKQETRVNLPRPMIHDGTLNFSFSGLKTAISREWKKYENHNESLIQTFAYEVQESITDVLVKKTLLAAKIHNASSILISGGVAANIRLREKFGSRIKDERSMINFFSPPIELCTDNAAYIGSYAFFRGQPIDWHEVDAIPDLSVEVTS